MISQPRSSQAQYGYNGLWLGHDFQASYINGLGSHNFQTLVIYWLESMADTDQAHCRLMLFRRSLNRKKILSCEIICWIFFLLITKLSLHIGEFGFPLPYVVFAVFLSQAWIKENFGFPLPYVVFAMFLFQAWIREVSSYWKLTVKSLPNYILDSILKQSRSLPTLTWWWDKATMWFWHWGVLNLTHQIYREARKLHHPTGFCRFLQDLEPSLPYVVAVWDFIWQNEMQLFYVW